MVLSKRYLLQVIIEKYCQYLGNVQIFPSDCSFTQVFHEVVWCLFSIAITPVEQLSYEQEQELIKWVEPILELEINEMETKKSFLILFLNCFVNQRIVDNVQNPKLPTLGFLYSSEGDVLKIGPTLKIIFGLFSKMKQILSPSDLELPDLHKFNSVFFSFTQHITLDEMQQTTYLLN